MSKRKKLSSSQIVCIVLLWLLMCAYITTHVKKIDGPLIVTLLLSGAFVFMPIYKQMRGKKNQ